VSTIVTAILSGTAVLLAGSLPWGAVLAPLNLRFFPIAPWAIVPMAIYLAVYWRYVGGWIGSPGSQEQRKTTLRAHPVAPAVWPLAIVTGLVGFAGLLMLVRVMARLVIMPESAPIVTPAGMPAGTGFALLVMSSIVAGVTEEAGFRGYMQGPIERRYGLAAGILVNGVMFGLLHFPNHPAAVISMLPYYVAVAAVYGGLTWATNSILPALALHAGGDVWSLTRLWLTGRPEWQLGATPQRVTETGVDLSFVAMVIVLVLLSAAVIALCRWVKREAAAA
jgi:membrane protease YdiL (CAAX protease family)